jgi:hypothetical protein
MGGKIILKKRGGGVGLVHNQNQGKVQENTGSGSSPFRKGFGKGWGMKKMIDRIRGLLKKYLMAYRTI